jgi:cytochrome c oxidase accessory protein FixG
MTPTEGQTHESFRDHIATINEEGKRNWIFPKQPKGAFYQKRTFVSIALLTVLFGMPFIRLHGDPFMLINVLERKFILFGIVFWPQDFHLFFLAMITGIVFVVLFTVVYGRIFCGWICPQTIFMEMVFRRIEYWIDGDRGQQIRLKKSGWTAEKIRKRVLKHSVFVLISMLISHTFLSYILSTDVVFEYVTAGPSEHMGLFVAMLIFTGLFYFVFSWFREQVCLVACPYGRLQGVMLDRKSIVVAYDYKRGENRSKWRKKEDRSAAHKGDCIDCGACVDVCPTGIDIRNGTQLECVNCTACIDACDVVMDRVGLEPGLIRYASEENIVEGVKPKPTIRSVAYSAVLVLLVGLTSAFLLNRSDVETTFLRVPGQVYQTDENGRIYNLYNFKIVNKTSDSLHVHFELLSHEGEIALVGYKDGIGVAKGTFSEGVAFVYIKPELLDGAKTKLRLGVASNTRTIERFKTNFNGPIR